MCPATIDAEFMTITFVLRHFCGVVSCVTYVFDVHSRTEVNAA